MSFLTQILLVVILIVSFDTSAHARMFRRGGGSQRRAMRRELRLQPMRDFAFQPIAQNPKPRNQPNHGGQVIEPGAPTAAARPAVQSLVQSKSWMGDVYKDKGCRDRYGAGPDREPKTKADVKPLNEAGVMVNAASGPFNFSFKKDKGEGKVWEGPAKVEAMLTKSPGSEPVKEEYEVPMFRYESSGEGASQIHTMTVMVQKPEKEPQVTNEGEVLELTKESYHKFSSDGNFIHFGVYKDDAGKIIAHYIEKICGERFKLGGEITQTDDIFEKPSPGRLKALQSLLSPEKPAPVAPRRDRDEAPVVPPMDDPVWTMR